MKGLKVLEAFKAWKVRPVKMASKVRQGKMGPMV